MLNELLIVSATAALVGFVHTAIGPDHYIPFIALARARNWSALRTTIVTALCGVGHVASSIILGLIGVAVGMAVFKLKWIESWRGDIAAWLLIVFGFAYLVWGLWRAIKNKPHTHSHVHADGSAHEHDHNHASQHAHLHEKKKDPASPWALFIIFVFGPCEPLIPLVMVPASRGDIAGTITVSVIFSLVTIATMTAIVLLSLFGLSRIRLPSLGRYSHALAGLAILLCGGAIKFLGL